MWKSSWNCFLACASGSFRVGLAEMHNHFLMVMFLSMPNLVSQVLSKEVAMQVEYPGVANSRL